MPVPRLKPRTDDKDTNDILDCLIYTSFAENNFQNQLVLASLLSSIDIFLRKFYFAYYPSGLWSADKWVPAAMKR